MGVVTVFGGMPSHSQGPQGAAAVVLAVTGLTPGAKGDFRGFLWGGQSRARDLPSPFPVKSYSKTYPAKGAGVLLLQEHPCAESAWWCSGAKVYVLHQRQEGGPVGDAVNLPRGVRVFHVCLPGRYGSCSLCFPAPGDSGLQLMSVRVPGEFELWFMVLGALLASALCLPSP